MGEWDVDFAVDLFANSLPMLVYSGFIAKTQTSFEEGRMEDLRLQELVEQDSEVIVPAPLTGFREWCQDLLKEVNPDLVVGIARGAIRLLQLQGLDRIIGDRLISNHALPFIPPEHISGKRILLFDDSVVFGSTMAELREYLSARGARVITASFVVDRLNFLGEPKKEADEVNPSPFRKALNLTYKEKLWPAAMRVHHDVVARMLLKTPEHYNIEFPTCLIRCHKFPRQDVPLLIELLDQTLGGDRTHDVSQAEAFGAGIYRYTSLLPLPSQYIFANKDVRVRPYCKIRTTISPDLGQIRLTPIIQLAFDDSVNLRNIAFSERVIGQQWNTLVLPPLEDRYYKQAVFRLLTSFVSVMVARSVIQPLFVKINEDFAPLDFALQPVDMRITLGRENADCLLKLFESLPKLNLGSLEFGIPVEEGMSFDEPLDRDLIERVKAFWTKSQAWKPTKDDLVYEMLAKVFLTMSKVIDGKEARVSNPNASRLDVGFSFGALLYLLNSECGIDLPKNDLSVAIDACVDNGQAVPRVLNVDSTWHRAFYSGERVQSVDPLQLKNLYHKAYGRYLKTKKATEHSRFDLQKVSVTLKDLHPWLPITTKFSPYGRTGSVTQASDTDLVMWLTPEVNPVLVNGQGREKQRTLKVNPDYSPVAIDAIEDRKLREFYDSFHYLSGAFANLDYMHKLLLSTCFNHRYTYNSIAAEAYLWALRGRYNFYKLLESGIVLNDLSTPYRSFIATNLYWSIRYLSEARNKDLAFSRDFRKLYRRIEKSFTGQGVPASNFWEFDLQKRFSSDVDDDVENAFRFLWPIMSQMVHLTSYAYALFNQTGLLDDKELEMKFEDQGVRMDSKQFAWLDLPDNVGGPADLYNQAISSGELPGATLWKTRLPDARNMKGLRDARSYEDIRRTVSLCYTETYGVLRQYCKAYRVIGGEDLEFLPIRDTRVTEDGSVERVHRNAFLLTFDIIGSTDSEKTNIMKDRCLEVLSGFVSQGIKFETTGNDAYIVVSHEPEVLLDVAESLMLEGERIREIGDKMRGTKKALSFGRVEVITQRNGAWIIRDHGAPNAIPPAFYLLEGFKAIPSSFSADLNSVILVDSQYLSKFPSVQERYGDHGLKIRVESKHYNRPAFAFTMQRRLKRSI